MIIKANEYERLPKDTKNKLIKKRNTKCSRFCKKPIQIKNFQNKEIVSEKVLQKLILEDISLFLKELGNGFMFIQH